MSLLVAVLLWQDVNSQPDDIVTIANFNDSLDGKWKGQFYNQIDLKYTPIELVFQRKKDLLKIYSYTQFDHDLIVCQLLYKKILTDSIQLTELVTMSAEKKPDIICRQIFNLHIAKEENTIVMTGTWESYENRARRGCGKGTIYLIKDH